MRLALAQIDTVVGDLDGNRDAHPRPDRGGAASAGADLVLFPELAVTGYPPEDLLLRPGLRPRGGARRSSRSPRAARGIVAVVGTPHFDRDLYNACAVCADGEVKAFVPQALPAELRRLRRGPVLRARARALSARARRDAASASTMCEDMWQPGPPATDLALAGARADRQHLRLAVPLSASDREREEMFVTRARDNSCFVAFCNAVGGQDELIFDGHSLVHRRRGHGARARRRLRGGAARRRRRAVARSSARRLRTCGGARSRGSATATSPVRGGPRRRRRASSGDGGRAARSRRSATSSSRCASRSSSGCTTTSRRTASATSSSASRAGSTRR